MRKRIWILGICIGLLLIAGGCGSAGNEEKDMYSGTYVDRQGTEDSIYHELELRYLEEGVYEVYVGIFRIGASEGLARVERDTQEVCLHFPKSFPSPKSSLKWTDISFSFV